MRWCQEYLEASMGYVRFFFGGVYGLCEVFLSEISKSSMKSVCVKGLENLLCMYLYSFLMPFFNYCPIYLWVYFFLFFNAR